MMLETGLTGEGLRLYKKMGFRTVKTYNGAKVKVASKKSLHGNFKNHGY